MNQSTPFTENTHMSVSGLLHRKETEELSVCVMIEDNEKNIEIRMPGAEVLANHGYSDREVKDITDYLEQNMEDIKAAAKEVNPMKAFMK